MNKQRMRRKIKFDWRFLGLIGLLLCGIGLFVIILRAAVVSVTREAENAQYSGKLATVTDPNASGGSALKFGNAGSLPAPNIARAIVNELGQVNVFFDQSSPSTSVAHYDLLRNGTQIASLTNAQLPSNLVGARTGTGASLSILGTSNTDITDSNKILDGIVASGAKWVRIDFYWYGRELSKNHFDWSTMDSAVDRAHARGLNIIGMIAYTPPWARPAGTTDKTPPTNLQDYADFARACAVRYGHNSNLGKYRNNPVTVWEIWNEPNIATYWQDSPSSPIPNPVRYTQMLKLAFSSIRAADANTTIMSGGLAPASDEQNGSRISPQTFLSDIYANGGKGSFDTVGLHVYTEQYPPTYQADWNTYLQTKTLHDLMNNNGDGSKKIWSTEAGYGTGTCSSCVDQATQATYTAEAIYSWYAWSYTNPFTFWVYRDEGTDGSQKFETYGFVTYNFVAKQSLATFKKVNNEVRLLDSSTPATGTLQYQVRAVSTGGVTVLSNIVTVKK